MSNQWRLGCTYTSADRMTHLTEIREDGPHGASRLVCTALPEDAQRIVEAVADHEALKADYLAAIAQADDWHRMYVEERERRVALERVLRDIASGHSIGFASSSLANGCDCSANKARAALAATAERRGEGEA